MKNISQIIKAACLLVCMVVCAFAVRAAPVVIKQDTLNKSLRIIADSLDAINSKLPVEKIYVHTDKPDYNIGDTIWFKVYLVDNNTHTASNISKILYLQLDNDSADVVDRISIRINNGVGWGQLPLRKVQYTEGSYTLRAYTMWAQNFQFKYIFSRRLYLGTPVEDTWLIKSNTAITRDDNKTLLNVSLFLNRLNKLQSPVALKDVNVRIYDDKHYLFNEEMQTGLDGSLKFTGTLKNNMDGRRMRVQITSLEPGDNNKVIQIPLVVNRSQKIDLQFLPEGGKLVTGIKSVIGFKAVGEDGRGTAVSGAIFDSKGNRVVDFADIHNGMGSVMLIPKANETYTAKIEQPLGITNQYALPKAEPFGTVMHIDNAENEDSLTVSFAGLNDIVAKGGFYVVGTSRSKICYSKKISPNEARLVVDKLLFPTGIARFTLFNGISPLNERIVFIDNHDYLQIKVTPNQSKYDRRDAVSLNIEVKDKNGAPVQGRFSLSSTDDKQVKADSAANYGIAAGLLINPDLMGDYGIVKLETFNKFPKGEIESPGYYINRPDKQAWQALDNLMLTQGWTDYKWTGVFAAEKTVFFAPQTNLDVVGKVSSLLNNTANIPVIALSQKPALFSKILTDKNGMFVFKDLQKIDTGSFFIQALKSNGKLLTGGVITIYRSFSPYDFHPSIKYPILPWYVNSDTTQINLAKLMAERAKIKYEGILLNEVKIKEKKIIRNSWNPYGAGNADYVFDENDIKKSGEKNFYDFLKQNIPGIRAAGVHTRDGKTIAQLTFDHRYIDIKVDGNFLEIDTIKTLNDEIEELSKIPLSNIRGIELAFSRKYTNVNGAQPKLIITTYKGDGMPRYFQTGTKTFRPFPITAPKVFYSPKYAIKAPLTPVADYRPTLHWEPNIITNADGKAIVSFFTSDSGGGITVNIQGQSVDGNLGSALYSIPAK